MRPTLNRLLFLGQLYFCWLCLVCTDLSGAFWPAYTEDIGVWADDQCQANIAGPLFESGFNNKESWTALRPIAGQYRDHCIGEEQNYFLYPFFSSQNSASISNWSIFNLFKGRKEFSSSGELLSSRLVLFPLFERHYDACNQQTCYSFFPVKGNVRNYFGQNSIQWTVFPLYLTIEKCGVTTHHLPWPIIRWQTGPDAGGFGIWPLFGRMYVHGQYDKRFFLWPLIYHEEKCIPNVGVERGHAFLPFYEYRCSPNKEIKRFLWPFFSHIEQVNPCYVETQYLWPLFVQGRGENQYVNRWAPFYSRSIRRGVDRRWLLWPLIHIRQWNEAGLYIKQERLLYFLFNRQTQTSCSEDCDFTAQKTSLFPIFSYWDNGHGEKQFQFPSPFETFFPTNKGIKRMYNPLFAIVKARVNQEEGVAHQSILWNFIRTEKSPEHQKFRLAFILDIESECTGDKRFEFLKGLIGYRKENGVGKFRFLWLSI